MNCSDVQALLGQMIDGVVTTAQKRGFMAHIRECDRCKRSYELEVVAKSLVQSTLPRVPTPMAVRRSVLGALADEAERSSRPWFTRVFAGIPTPAYIVAVAAVALIYFFFPAPQTTSLDDMIRHVGERDVIEQATANFSRIRDGEIRPAMTTCSPENVYAYLHSQGLPFEALVRPMDKCDGYSAMVNEYDGVKLAHVVYTMGSEILYVYQVQRNESMSDTGHLSMPPAARDALVKTGWYTDPQHPDCNIVLWEENGTLCAATSSMSKTKMLALLATR